MPDPNQNVQQNITSDPKGEKIANSQLFNVVVWFNNHTTEPYQLPTQHILELALEEDLLNWPYKGYLIYNNRYEGVERNISPNAYFYRMDARDELKLEIKVVPADPMRGDFPPETWEMNLDLVIYDTEDIPSTNIAAKSKKIYFWDKRYQMMLDKKLPWSTVAAQRLKNASHLTDSERGMLTGDAIEALLTQPEGANYEGSIDTDNWDSGTINTFYNSPTHNTLIDDLNHLLDSHISQQDDDLVILKYSNRIDGQWQLVPLHKFFDNAGGSPDAPGKWQLEHFFFEDIESEEGNTTPYRAPYKEDLDFEVDIKIAEWNKITTYKFTDMSGIDNTKALVSKPVYSYCFENGQFGLDYEENEIEKVKSEFKRLYTDKLLPAGKAAPIFTLNDTKKNQINIAPEFSFARFDGTETKQSRLKLGRCKILYAGLFLNEFIKFRVIGSPHRTVGKFIGIERKTSDSQLKFDDKICGQWLVTDVKHIWNHNRYVNDICAVKVHMYQDNDVNEDIE